MSTWSYSLMPDEQKRELCLELLEEFGATGIQETTKGELRHRCTLPIGAHTDRNSITASVNYRKLVFRCYVCNNRGGLLWWIATNRGENTEQSEKWLSKESGVSEVLDLPMLLKLIEALARPKNTEVQPMPTYDERILDSWRRWRIFHPYLTLPISEGGRECPEVNLARYKVGYCDEDVHWRYHQRIIIPLHWNGALVGWQARKLLEDDPEPAKYRNTPQFPRDRTVYGDLGERDIVLVESPLSVLRHAHHLPMVATFGSAVSDMQIPLLHRYRRVTLWYDNDKSGWEGVYSLIARLKNYVDLRIVDSPWDADPADMTEAEAAELVEGAIPYMLWSKPMTLTHYERAA
jgi:hypothetical protein